MCFKLCSFFSRKGEPKSTLLAKEQPESKNSTSGTLVVSKTDTEKCLSACLSA